MKIAVIDDDERNSLMFRIAVRRAGANALFFRDTAEALEYLRNHDDVRLVFTGYGMPHMDGIALIRDIRGMGGDVPIIMVTAAGDDVYLEKKALEAGASDCIAKPFTSSEVEEKIARYADPEKRG